ncbi:UDP-N-acetylglucosamine--N-acetylmuramyl-(pentapeptide) pyrophosphoryl-undecaprenol N-acetylglucosamine transferase [Frondihabitans cladoniiphilus]|uniref:UDP-N-acetylglucosamine--N-acetylmuramyl-(pentapeptide) pyrophosphoryl-undecaprenol N-acetylglucosamine transferase n=1 Tax=Frondihabitans cladoniiphilus TaxID=715785 RepID=A0ABP8W0H9_9MICO
MEESHSRRPLRVVIGAGGTGGHIYPGLATADAIRMLVPDAVVSFSGTARGLETILVPRGGYPLDTVPMRPFVRSRGASRGAFPWHLGRSILVARRHLTRDSVDVVIGMGGYPSIPVVLAARSLGLPCLVHESNAVPGRANALAARFVAHVATGFPTESSRWCRACEVRHVGVPLDRSIEGADVDRARAREHFGMSDGQRLVVVSGGSQGAASLDEAAVQLAFLWKDRNDVRLLVKTRSGGSAAVVDRLEREGGERIATAVEFIDRMDFAYAAADAVVVRAGSATVAELQQSGTPAVLVPYPHAPGDHQTWNARLLTDAGQGVLIPDHELSAERLAASLDRLFASSRTPPPSNSPHTGAAERLARWAIDLASARRGIVLSRKETR